MSLTTRPPLPVLPKYEEKPQATRERQCISFYGIPTLRSVARLLRRVFLVLLFMKGLHDICGVVGCAPGKLVCLTDATHAQARCEELVRPIGGMIAWGLWAACACACAALARLDKADLMFRSCAFVGAAACVPLAASSALSFFGRGGY
ncbi:hypothetical protein F5X97DRAFT_327860 [Nemania serpens]|nr:hypothetical protein F5X97DRAFT_327860 [Nemania serpens]